jgi:hypothetical protein
MAFRTYPAGEERAKEKDYISVYLHSNNKEPNLIFNFRMSIKANGQ